MARPVTKLRTQTIRLPKGLTKEEAWRRAFKKATRDFRGGKYDAKTGRMVLI